MKTVYSRYFVILALFLGIFITSCITDGPNQTGEQFLKDQNLLVTRELKSVKFDYPVDSFWVESFEPSHLNSSYFPLSNERGFDISSRLGFYFAYDSVNLAADSSEQFDAMLLNFQIKDFRISSTLNSHDSLLIDSEKLGGQSLIIRSLIVDSISLESLAKANDNDNAESKIEELVADAIELKNEMVENLMVFLDSMSLYENNNTFTFATDTIKIPTITN